MTIEIERDGSGCAVVVVDRAPANALDARTAAELVSALAATQDAPSRVLAARGRLFCAGADRDELAIAAHDGTLADAIRRVIEPVSAAVLALRTGPPTVAAVSGSAAGGGLGLALACDWRVSVPSARFVTGFARLGLTPDSGTSYFLPRLIGAGPARRMLLHDEPLDATRAGSLGLVDEVVAPEELRGRAVAEACSIAASAVGLLAGMRDLLGPTALLRSHLDREIADVVAASRSEAARAALATAS